ILCPLDSYSDCLLRYEMTTYIAQVNYYLFILDSIIALGGFLGNLLALVVINRKPLKNTSSSVFITYLALFDISVLIVHVFSISISHFKLHNLIVHCFITYATDLTTFCSIWILIIITLERCIAVHWPFLSKRFCTIRFARLSIYILIVMSFIFFTTTFLLVYEPNFIHSKCTIRKNLQKIIRIYKPVIFYYIPDLLLLSNLFIVYGLCVKHRRHTRTLKLHNESLIRINDVNINRKQRQLTVMLITVSLSFYLFTTPAIINFITQLHPPKHRNVRKLKKLFLQAQVTVLLLQMNNATNFIFYCLAGQRFRAVCLQTIREYYSTLKYIYYHHLLRQKAYMKPQKFYFDTKRYSTFQCLNDQRHESISMLHYSVRQTNFPRQRRARTLTFSF
ncbi:unnamed protein product, partial [Didymodactylos carnosus]